MKNLLVFISILFCGSIHSQDLNGIWYGNNIGTYYVRQIDNEVWWFGDAGNEFGHVFHGKIHNDKLYGEYVDVPSGKLRNTGRFTIEIRSSSELVLIWSDKSTSNEKWTRGKKEETGFTSTGIAGVWKTNYKDMILKREGNRVYGNYEHKEGRIEGILTGTTLKGTWKQSNGTGELIFYFNDEFTTFTSKYSEGGKWYSDWKGEKIKN